MAVSKKLISLHPRFAAVADVAAALILIWLLKGVGTVWFFVIWMFARPLWWAVLVQSTFYPSIVSQWRHFFALTLFALGGATLLVFAYASQVKVILQAVLVLAPAVSFWLVPKTEVALSFTIKPLRRWLWIMSVVGLMGIWSGVYASQLFQIAPLSTVAIFILAATVLTVAVSGWWWREYEVQSEKGFFQALGIIGLLVTEIAFSLATWPVGYFISAFVIIWVWYILWLMLRFALSAEGIRWKQQGRFLILNAILLFAYTFFIIRWK